MIIRNDITFDEVERPRLPLILTNFRVLNLDIFIKKNTNITLHTMEQVLFYTQYFAYQLYDSFVNSTQFCTVEC